MKCSLSYMCISSDRINILILIFTNISHEPTLVWLVIQPDWWSSSEQMATENNLHRKFMPELLLGNAVLIIVRRLYLTYIANVGIIVWCPVLSLHFDGPQTPLYGTRWKWCTLTMKMLYSGNVALWQNRTGQPTATQHTITYHKSTKMWEKWVCYFIFSSLRRFVLFVLGLQ